MRFGIPRYRLPRDVLDAEIQRILDLGVDARVRREGRRTSRAAMREGGFDAAFLAVGAHIGKRAYIPAGEAAHILDAVSLLRSMEGEERPLLGRRVVVYGGGNTAMDAARTAKRLGAERGDRRLPPHARARCPRTTSRSRRRSRRACMMKWLSTIKQRRRGQAGARADGARRERLPAADRRDSRSCEADSLVLALGQDADLSLLDGVPGLRDRRRRRAGRRAHDDRPRGHLRRRRHGARRAHRDGRRSATASRPRATSTPGCAASAYAHPRGGRARRASSSSTPGTTPTRRSTVAPAARRDPPPVDLRGGRRRASTRTNALFEARRCL